ncbi:MAG TPA: BatA domain-containing protein, partial [Rhodopila sp.]
MIFVAPWVLFGLLALPLLWWLLRVTPPAPRSEVFPAVRFLLGLNATEETPARTPWWLMALRLLAAGLVIVALARPVLDAGTVLAGKGPVLLVVDNGWASADDWVRRKEAAGALLDRAERAGRGAALLTTAPDGSGVTLAVSATMPVTDLRARLAAMQPQPWPSDRAAAVDAMRAWRDKAGASVIYVPDGLTDGADFDRFAAALRDIGPVTEICCDTAS